MSAQKEQENYSKSIQHSIDQAKASLQELATDILYSKVLKGLVDIFTQVIQWLDKIVQHPLLTLLFGGGLVVGVKKWLDNSSIISMTTNIQTLTDVITGNTAANEANKKSILDLAKARLESVISSKAETDATNQETIAENGNVLANESDAYSEMMEAQAELASATSSTTETIATQEENASQGINLFSNILKGLKGKILSINPIIAMLGIAIAASGTAAFIAYKYFNRYRDSLENAKKSAEDAQNEFDKVQSELNNVQSQIEAIKSDGVITITEQADLDRLEQENKALETQLEYRKLIAEEANKDVVEKAKDVWNDEFASTSSQADTIIQGQMMTGAIGMPGAGMATIGADTTQKTKTEKIANAYKEAWNAHDSAVKELEEAQRLANADGEITEDEQKQIAELTQKEKDRNDALKRERTKRQEQLDVIQEQIDNLGLTEEGRNSDEYKDALSQQKHLISVDPESTAKWNEMQISSVADELGLTEEELSKLAETGVNTLDVVDGLTEGMKDADLIIEDGESELSIFNKYLADYKKNIDSASDSTESWSSTLSSALKKLGESDEDFKKYVETLKELNPSLAGNQENLEKVALVNLQFSKASEDLQSNFEKYKQILSEDNELSVDYANTISSLADDLTYLTGVDFDIAKTQEWTKSAENVKLLEEALEGSEQALANLRESVQSSEDTIEQAIRDGRRINELQDVQIELGLNTDEFNTELVNLVEWMDNTDLGTITAFADLNDAPFLQKLLELASKSEETATALKAMFNDLGWDIEWDTTQMMVPNANGGNVAGGIPSDVASKLRGYNANTNSVHYDLVPMDVPTNIHFTNKKNNASFVNKNTPKSIPKSSGGSSGGGGGSKDSETEPKEEVFDWIEVNIKRLEEAIDRLDKKVNASYKNWYDRMHAIPEELSYVLGEIQTQETAYARYMQQANSVGLAEPYAALVRQGGMDISTISDENLANQIKQYQEYYEKAQSCADKVEDLKQKVADLAKQRFDNLVKQFDDVIERVTHAQDLINTMIETTKAQGYIVGTTYYSTLIDMENNHLQKLEREYKDLKNAQAEAVQIGAIEEYSQTWNEMQSQIESVESAIYGAKKAIVEYKNELRQVEWDLFDRKQDYISLIKDESDWLQELLRTEHKITDETSGRLNNYGKSIGALQVVDYQTSMEQARRYADEIRKINEEVAKDPYNTKLIDRKNELIKAQREAIKAAEDEKKAIHDLIQESYQEMLRILQELINKRKEALDAEKDLYDYKNNVQEQADNISSIQKQIMSLQGDDSEENQARLQTLVTNLKEAQRELQDTEYNKWLTDQKRMMDDLYSSAEELLNERLDNIDLLLEEMIETTNINKDEIKETIEQEALTVGYTITEETQNILNGLTYNADILLSVGNVVDQICVFVDAMRSFSENIAINIATMIANNLAAHNDDVHNASLIVNAINNAAAQISSSVGSAFNAMKAELASARAAAASSVNNSGSSSNSSKTHVTYIPGTGKTVHWTGSAKTGIHIKYAEGGIIGKPAHFAKTDNSTNSNNTLNALGKTSNLKRARYAKGGTIGSEIRSLGEDGIILARSGEEVLSLEKVKGMKDVLQAFEPLAMAVTKLPSATNNTTNLGNNEINVSFTLPNVTNYEEFIQTAKTDARFEKIIQQMTIGNALGNNSLKKYTL